MIHWNKIFFLLGIIILASSFTPIPEHSIIFNDLRKEGSQVFFSNKIIENDTLNYFNLPYLENDVSSRDINNGELPDFYFIGNFVLNKLYLNKGNLKLKGITKSANISGYSRPYSETTMKYINNDGALKLLILNKN